MLLSQNKIFLLLLGQTTVFAVSQIPALDHIKPSASNDVQAAAVQDLIRRKVGQRAEEFSVKIDPKIGPAFRDTFKLETEDGQLTITGTSGVAASWGFYHYMKTYCGGHVSWGGEQLKLPDKLPQIPAPGFMLTTLDRFRYYQNVCTSSYSFVWWDWERWEWHIDWMAMSGINIPLAQTAQEAIWQRVYLKMGFNQTDIESHFVGPAFLAWGRMGNINGWGGPLPQSWHENQVALQHKILDRMRSLGMMPITPAFAGHVPKNITRLYPDAVIAYQKGWVPFPAQYCCTAILDMSDPLFSKIGRAYLEEYDKEFGLGHIYSADPYNEMIPTSTNLTFIEAMGKGIFGAMTVYDPQAVWLMQAWSFSNTQNWPNENVETLMHSVPQGRLIMLDLYTEVRPLYIRLESYYGQPWIWCMLHDFGGKVQMFGHIDAINSGPMEGRNFPNSTMIGIGLTPEGINQNDMIYEFMNENSWRPGPRNLSEWTTDYSRRRYGASNVYTEKAWALLTRSVYNLTTDSSTDPLILHGPGFGMGQFIYYQPEDLFQAWDNFLLAAPSLKNSDLFSYDLVDVTRQSLEIIAVQIYNDFMKFYKYNDYPNVRFAMTSFLNLLDGMDVLLGTDRHFLLGDWLESAKSHGTNEDEKTLMEFNARIQLTLWGPDGEINDYAIKEWSGMISGYYRRRWALFFHYVKIAMIFNTTFNSSAYGHDMAQMIEFSFPHERTLYPSKPVGDPLEQAEIMHSVFRPSTIKHQKFYASLQKATKHLAAIKTGSHNKAYVD